MNEDIFDFDIDAQLEQAEKRAQEKANEVPVELNDEADCEGCKIWIRIEIKKAPRDKISGAFFYLIIRISKGICLACHPYSGNGLLSSSDETRVRSLALARDDAVVDAADSSGSPERQPSSENFVQPAAAPVLPIAMLTLAEIHLAKAANSEW